ncbi:MAG: FliM/FliN family flagellar motor switch protein [Planctomycetota bacterium]
MSEISDQEIEGTGPAEDPGDAGVAPIALEEFAPPGPSSSAAGAPRNLGRVMDVSVNVSARIGMVRKTISDVLDLLPGSVVDLGRGAGEPVDLVIGDKLVARGEIVVVDDHYGIRVTEVVQDS